ncbi:LytTR family transcriptional regulator DNA-binding domain-containing protein [Williamwhitmania taraxaci]|uniref:LytTR family transcriptional regulator DNA-binding domain-containing protein n=1 Tax=Williamwhitmania taraxaci TaxID=1640674 RepID=UPI000B8088E7
MGGTTSTVLSTSNTITSVEKIINDYGHIRCHRNFIINPMLAVNFCKQTSTIPIEGINIPVSRRKRSDIENIPNQ